MRIRFLLLLMPNDLSILLFISNKKYTVCTVNVREPSGVLSRVSVDISITMLIWKPQQIFKQITELSFLSHK